MIETLLVANRGEIALRVMRTAREMGIRTVAICAALDADAPHVRAADTSVLVPSYLDIGAVASRSVQIATVRMPIRRAVRITRSAISPRLAIRSVSITATS